MAGHPKDAVGKEIEPFEKLEERQRLERLSLQHDPIEITMPDGTVKEGKKWETTPFDIAKGISKSLAKDALISQVNGVLWDLKRPLEGDCELKIFKLEDDEGLDTFLHSSAHILGQEYIQLLEEAKKCDHILLGTKQELFFQHPLSPGSWFFLPRGTRIYDKLMTFIEDEYRNRGYKKVISPNICNMQLWETSGHAANYKENMFVFEIEKQEFGWKSMNGPEHCLMFQSRVRSYRDLPLRLVDFGVLHRNEASGALTGLTRVRRFQQDDAYIFCTESQIKDEVRRVLKFINYCYGVFGFTYDLKLSKRPEKFLGDIETWNRAEAALTEALDECGKPWEINEADGTFYGPKIDISVSDALKRKFECATLEVDFQLPSRFALYYSAGGAAKREKPIMIHTSILGSVERMFAILLEHCNGKWPFWLSPRQAIVCPVSGKSQSYALKVKEQLHEARYYVDVDTTDRSIQEKVREAQLAQYNYILVVGEEEAKTGRVTVRVRDSFYDSIMSMEDLLSHFSEVEKAYH